MAKENSFYMAKEDSFLEMFEDPAHAARYSEGPAKFMPGYQDVQRMTGVLMREHVPAHGEVLVHGAGGGLELEVFAQENSDWTFVGVDPAKPMLDVAAARLGTFMERTELHHGYIETAPEGPFDAATSLLTLHFLAADARRKTVSEIVSRLKPGAPLIVAHSSFPSGTAERDVWLSRYAAFAVASGVDPEMACRARDAVSMNLPPLDPEQNVTLLREAGLEGVSLFYSAFAWHGWVGYAPH